MMKWSTICLKIKEELFQNFDRCTVMISESKTTLISGWEKGKLTLQVLISLTIIRYSINMHGFICFLSHFVSCN